MRPDDRDPGYLWDMLDAARTIREFTTGVTVEAYLRDRKLQLAVERALEIIGEAARSPGADQPNFQTGYGLDLLHMVVIQRSN